MMQQLDWNILYCDTDSIVYIKNESTKSVIDSCIGTGLGEWTNELNGCYVQYWCYAVPKDTQGLRILAR